MSKKAWNYVTVAIGIVDVALIAFIFGTDIGRYFILAPIFGSIQYGHL